MLLKKLEQLQTKLQSWLNSNAISTNDNIHPIDKLQQILILHCLEFTVQLSPAIPNLRQDYAENLFDRIDNLSSNLIDMYQLYNIQPMAFIARTTANNNEYALLAWEFYRIDLLDEAINHGFHLSMPDDRFFVEEIKNRRNNEYVKNVLLRLTRPEYYNELNIPHLGSFSVNRSISTPVTNTSTPELPEDLSSSSNNTPEPKIEPSETITSEITKLEVTEPEASKLEITKPEITIPVIKPKPKSPTPTLSAKQAALVRLNDLIQQLNYNEFNNLIKQHPDLLPGALNALAIKLNTYTKKKHKVFIEFTKNLSLSLADYFQIYSKVDSIPIREILLQKMSTFKAEEFFQGAEIIKLAPVEPKQKNSTAVKKNESNLAWLDAQINEYFNFIAANPTKAQEADKQWPISQSMHFKDAFRKQNYQNNPIWKKLLTCVDHDEQQQLLEQLTGYYTFEELSRTDEKGYSLLSWAIENSQQTFAISMISDVNTKVDNVTRNGDTLLHYCAHHAPNNIELFKAVYSRITNAKHRLQTDRDLNNFLQILILNPNATEASCFEILKVIFDAPMTALALKNQIPEHEIMFLILFLLTENETGNTVFTLSENRDWRLITGYVFGYIEALMENISDNAKLNNFLNKIVNILDHNTENNIFVTSWEKKDYETLLHAIETRQAFRRKLFEMLGSKLGGDVAVKIIRQHELFSMRYDGTPLHKYIFKTEFDGQPQIESIRAHNALKYFNSTRQPITELDVFIEFIKKIVHEDASLEDVKPEVDRLIAMIKDYGFDPKLTDYHNFNIISYLIIANYVPLAKYILANLPLEISVQNLFEAINFSPRSDYTTIRIIFMAYQKQHEAKPEQYPSFYNATFDFNDPHDNLVNTDLLEYAVLNVLGLNTVEFLLELQKSSETKQQYLRMDFIVDRILHNIGQTFSENKTITYQYAFMIIKFLFSKISFSEQLQYIDSVHHTNHLSSLFVTQPRLPEDVALLHKIMELLLDNGCDLTNVDISKQNIFHYCVKRLANTATFKFVREQVIKRYSDKTLQEMLNQRDSAGFTPVESYIQIFSAAKPQEKHSGNDNYKLCINLIKPEKIGNPSVDSTATVENPKLPTRKLGLRS